MNERVLSREHQRLVEKFQKQLARTGLSYAQVGISISMSRSGVHHLVNGTGGRFPNEQTFDRLVRAMGGDPTAKTWKAAYEAACHSYGKQLSTAPVVVAKDANTPQRPPRRRGLGGLAQMSVVIALPLFGVLLSGLLGVLLRSDVLPAAEHSREPMPTQTVGSVAVIEGEERGVVPVYRSTDSREEVDLLHRGTRLPNACRLIDKDGVDWVRLIATRHSKTGYVDARYVRDPQTLMVCEMTP
ncbi:helix-turn-helix transcriptional regulator [Streptomyces sp. PAN_FS17]|uniref:helix-turn-helix domain-containing protein n=1 Tax=Streptomyces sp. PAN_FS17 TaxID=1855351 RepID=UPI00089CA3FB|nr:helix-turn-helix transcriptional regulator [Streptomyces sp. PAN_FS17]SEC64277.1 hypothetical protein SAMN05216482_4067 [Streptomyces sp. PAN_FS17]